ncbi:MAG: Endoribonuclease YbeY [Planctomycetes bacterium ADurb.Bin401]|nr:MAG: Endoribonuclease YbeY [Planctomycetes bacterium ADurb.Bin401]
MPESRDAMQGIKINFFKSDKSIHFDKDSFTNLIRETAKLFGLRKALINIEIADDKKIVEVNKKFLKSKKITDVISFDVSDDSEKVFDIIVNASLARRQAKLYAHLPQSELALYILHGLLHQLGFDDLTPRKASKMHRMEDKILRKHGFGVVYAAACHSERSAAK